MVGRPCAGARVFHAGSEAVEQWLLGDLDERRPHTDSGNGRSWDCPGRVYLSDLDLDLDLGDQRFEPDAKFGIQLAVQFISLKGDRE